MSLFIPPYFSISEAWFVDVMIVDTVTAIAINLEYSYVFVCETGLCMLMPQVGIQH